MRTLLQVRFGSFLAPLRVRIITSRHYLSEKTLQVLKMSKKIKIQEEEIEIKEDQTTKVELDLAQLVGLGRDLVEVYA